VWTESLVDGKFWVMRDTLMETLHQREFCFRVLRLHFT
jgi:hypothetical protein